MTRSSLAGPFRASVTAVVIALVVIAMEVPSMLATMTAGGAPDFQASQVLEQMQQRHEFLIERHIDRSGGRSMFNRPRGSLAE